MSEIRSTYLGALGIAAFFLVMAVAMAVALPAAGVVDERVASLWNPAVLGATALGLGYAAPRTPLRTLLLGGAALGLLYGGLVLAAGALGGGVLLLGPAQLLAQATALGALPPVAAGVFYRVLDRRSRRSLPPAG